MKIFPKDSCSKNSLSLKPLNQVSLKPHPQYMSRKKINRCSQCLFSSVQFSHSVALCDPMDCSTTGLPVHHQLPEFTQTRPLSRRFHPTISSSVVPFPPALNLSQHQGLFKCQLFTSAGQSIGISASASVPPMNIQD